MNWERVVDALVEYPWVEPVAEAVQGVISKIYSGAGPVGQQVQNFLNGTWLGHPLHPLLTDVPVGAYTVALAFDALEAAGGHPELQAGADAAVTLGVLSGLVAATAGATDWYVLHRRTQRVGMVHGLFNVGATALYATSLAFRKGGARGAGRALAFAGFAVLSVGAYLGGYLVYSKQIGVDHVAGLPEPSEFHPTLAMEELGDGQMRQVQVEDTPVLLVRRDGQVYALADTCSHQGCSLAEGELVGDSVRCSCHGSRFALADGRVLDGPSTYWQPVYRVRTRGGQIEVGKRELQE